ncbi:MAG TPA: hypothetical protein PL037_09090, partial [Elusimicrobiales bacterium]|nr:hypothetical protein [Elusimicrobiales bacterium]
ARGRDRYAWDTYGTYGPTEAAGRNALIRAGLTGTAPASGLPRQFHQSGYAAGANQSMDLMRMIQLLFQATGRTPRQIAAEIDSTSKEELWRKYGHNFASKEEAVAAYEKFQRNREDMLR